jgi:hypothetical protein
VDLQLDPVLADLAVLHARGRLDDLDLLDLRTVRDAVATA